MSSPTSPVKATAEQPIESVSTQLHNKTVLHKTVTSSGKESTWVSPFRIDQQDVSKKLTSKAKNPSSYISAGSTPITPPGTEEEPILTPNNEDEDDEAPLEADETVAEHVNEEDADEEEPITPEEEPITPEEEPITPEEEPIAEPEEEEEEEEEAVEDVATAESPAEELSSPTKVRPAKQEIPAIIKSHPKMLNRYKENFNITSQIMNKNRIENFDRRVDLGAGLVLTEEQIYELAKKKLEPLMKQIDDRVAENNARDAAAAAKVEETIRLNDEAVVAKELASYKATVDSKTKTIQAEHEKRTKQLSDKASKSKTSTENHIQKQKDEIIKDKKDSEIAEENAKNDHVTNKETLTKTADQLKIDKTQELEDSKAKQIEETEAAEKFQTDGVALQSKQVELKNELDAKKAELEEKIKKVEALIASKHEKKESIRLSVKRRKVADRSFDIIDAKHARAAANVAILSGQVGLLGDRLAAHSTKIDHLTTTAKDALTTKRGEATTAASEWEEHLAQVRLEEAKKQEQIRIAAEEERKRVEQEKAEEEARLAKEKEEEEAKIAKEKEEEEAKIAKEKEEAAIAAENKKKEEEEEAIRVAADLARMRQLQELNQEKIRLQKELEKQHNDFAAAEKARADAELKADETKRSSSAGILSGAAAAVIGATTGAVTGAAVAGSAVGNVASAATGAVGNTGDLATSSTPAIAEKLVEPTSYKSELEASNVGTNLGNNNPFYTGEFTENNDDLPSTIHEEEEEEEKIPKETTEPVELEVPTKTIEETASDNDTIGETPVEEPTVEEPTVEEPTVEEPVVDESAIEEVQISELNPDDDVSLQAAPVRRRSMVDEAIANMTPDKIAKMNTPLTAQLKAKAVAEGKSVGSTKAEKIAAAAAAATAAATEGNGKRSRSNSLLKLKRSASNLKNRSRSSSFKNDAPPNLAKKTPVESDKASNRTKVNASIGTSTAKTTTTTTKPINISASAATADASAFDTTVPATPTIENSSIIGNVPTTPFSIAPSGISETPIVAEAEAVQFKPNDESLKKVATPVAESSEDEDDSDLEPETANPVFTEKIGAVEETAPTTANTDSAVNDNFVEVSTLETVSSNEYHQHQDDPDYMVIEN
ncbi:hypothetical protein C6P40_005174 [Pichia californica]|uniref:Uncharacterized protein n=1 Tax=Pichia californica TaxID=460514 RepID=A0A9P6WLS6_9ASCO|nr:hypothetical protein C6P42_005442 [[Candida] californica]KAG0689352.1 hypothetical protein C6P40_005174 [[Candida] californica]